MAEKLKLDLSLVLPDVPDERDACVERLTRLLQAEGLEKVHVIREDGSARLCLHYDPQQFSVSRVRELAQAAGAKIGNRYLHETLRIDGMDCPTCATVIEHALQRMDGVLEGSVSYAAERLRLEYDSEKIERPMIGRRRAALLGDDGRRSGRDRMMVRLFLAGLLTISGTAQAVDPVNPPGLLPTEIARPLLEQDPGVAAARAGLDVALQEAGILDKSPYEWTARASGQQRRLDNGPRYNEWNVGIERAIRLSGKAAADRKLGTATVEASQARYGEALHESARELMALWVEWLAAERARELAESSMQSMRASLDTVDKRVRAGDASKLDLSIARAELAEQSRMDNDAKTQAATA